MKKMQMIMAVMVLTGCMLAQGCALVSKQKVGEVTRVGMFTMDPGNHKPDYIFAFYDGNVTDQAFSWIQLYAD